MASESLAVLLDGKHTADLVRGKGRRDARLVYTADAERPLSMSMPVEKREHGKDRAEPWLRGLLPDDPRVIVRWATEFGLTDMTTFALLGTPVGRDCAGAVQFCPHDEIEALTERGGSLRLLERAEFSALIRRLSYDNLAWLGDPVSLQFSLSGGETKTALHRVGDGWARPFGSTPSTHILKPELREHRFPDLPVNEHLCQTAARQLGLSAAHTEVHDVDGIQTLVVTRYDRLPDAQGRLTRVHQEDLCQALSVAPQFKYQRKGGPSVSDSASLLRSVSSDLEKDIRSYRDALIFNWVVAGTDAHAKNYGLLLSASGDVRLAPMYDLASALPYIEDREIPNTRLAQRIGKNYTLRKSDRQSAWVSAADALGLSRTETVLRAAEIAEALPEAMNAAVQSLPGQYRDSRTVIDLQRRLIRRSRECAQFELNRPTTVRSAADYASRTVQDGQSFSTRSVRCGQRLPGGRVCGRLLRTSACPHHPSSPGSSAVQRRLG